MVQYTRLVSEVGRRRRTGEVLARKMLQAAGGGNLDLVKRLLDKGVNPNKANEYGVLPLLEAARHGHLRVVQLLLDRDDGGNLNRANVSGSTPLLYAAQEVHWQV